MPSKYILTPPEGLHSLTTENHKNIYPDFDPWSHTPLEDKIFLNFVSKGYYNSSKVNFESISSRSSLHESLPAVSNLLAEQLSEVVRIREECINRITAKAKDPKTTRPALSSDLFGPGFVLPKRVTLTDHRRERWLQEISSPHSSLSEISKTIPHGFKRRQLLEQCYIKQVPLSRSIWLIKCYYSLEYKILMSKHNAQQADEIATKLLREWSETFVLILEKLVFEMTQFYNEPAKLQSWRVRIAYYMRLLGNCYSLNLMDSDLFHHWLVDFVTKIENFECLPMTLHILTVFWDGIFQVNENCEDPQQLFLINKMTEALLYKYYMVSTSKSMISDEQYLINDVKKNNKVHQVILAKLKRLIERIFHEQSMEAFVFPNNNWDIYKKCLYEILQVDKLHANNYDSSETSKKLELIVYRNDSLKFTTILRDAEFDENGSNCESTNDLENVFLPNTALKLKHVDYKLTKVLDENSAGDDWATFADQKLLQIEQIIQTILWALHPSRIHHYEASQLVAKLLLLKINSRNGLLEYSLEDKIWALVFVFAKTSMEVLKTMVSLPRLHQLLNVFISYGIVKVPTYIRKLISSGVLYLSHSSDRVFHCNLLINLKISPVMKSQYNMVLRNVVDSDPTFEKLYNYDKLMEMLEFSKEALLSGTYDFVEKVPYSVKLMASEWYLNLICSPVDGMLRSVARKDVIDKLKVFCINLEVYHQFYKWVEFIIYHQLLSDLDALECLVDILMYYDKLFPLLINDHILLMKTILHLQSIKLAPHDSSSDSFLLFNDFWRFFMKRFPLALDIDTELQTKLMEVHQSEQLQIERLAKPQTQGSETNPSRIESDISQILRDVKQESQNFPSVFQPNLKILLSSEDETALRTARKNMRLLMLMNLSEYNKFMSIFLKRRSASTTELAHLISMKVLSFNLIRKVISGNSLIELLETSSCDRGMAFELQKRNFIKHNLKAVLNILFENFDSNYLEIVRVVSQFSTTKYGQEQVSSAFGRIQIEGQDVFSFVSDLINFSINSEKNQNVTIAPNSIDTAETCGEETEDGDVTVEETDILKLFSRLNFTNLWIFQVLTNLYLRDSDANNCMHDSFVLDIIRQTNYDTAVSKLFDKVANIEVLRETLQTLEVDFFEEKSWHVHNKIPYYRVVIETIVNISRRLNKLSTGNIPMSEKSFDLMNECCQNFASKDSAELASQEYRLDAFLKILIVHQKFILKEGLEKSSMISHKCFILLKSLCQLFHKIGFSLKIKLLLYDVLASMKSFAIYSTSGKGQSLSNGNKTKVPEELVSLPPFKISSFMPEDTLSSGLSSAELGICDKDPDQGTDKSSFFFYDKTSNTFMKELVLRPFHLLDNYQEGTDFNNTSLNLCLFNASFDRKNPT